MVMQKLMNRLRLMKSKIDFWFRWQKYLDMFVWEDPVDDAGEPESNMLPMIFVIVKGQFVGYKFAVRKLVIEEDTVSKEANINIKYDITEGEVQNIEKLDFDDLVGKIVQAVILEQVLHDMRKQ